MANNSDIEVDLAAREAAQHREEIALIAAEATRRVADETVEDNEGRIFNLNRPLVEHQFENTLKQGLLQTIQYNCVFRGKVNEDHNTHLMDFEEIMNTFQYNGVSKDAIYLRAFPFSLKDDMKHWLRSLPTGSIRTWEDMTKSFLDKYFLSAKTDFWDGLTPPLRRTLNTVVGGPLMNKTPEEIVAILDELSEDANQWPAENNDRRKSVGVHQIDSNTSMQAQLDSIANEIRKLTLANVQSQPSPVCDLYGMGHPTYECQSSIAEEVLNVVGNFDRGNYQSDETLETYGLAIREHGASIIELGTTFRNLERQAGQLAILLSERVPGTLPTDTERNPKETINLVSLRSGHELEEPIAKKKGELIEGHMEIVEE
nr:uncharacterized protein LOC104092703 [Nicotiana tomentosiformis]